LCYMSILSIIVQNDGRLKKNHNMHLDLSEKLRDSMVRKNNIPDSKC
jgi:hypothetical protein